MRSLFGIQDVRKVLRTLVVVAIVFLGFQYALTVEPAGAASADLPITGYAWSDTMGWIDLHCSNSNSCATRPFGLTMAPDGTISGYAWSEYIGWVSANLSEVSGCPDGLCDTKISGTKMVG